MPTLKKSYEQQKEEVIDHLVGNCECEHEHQFSEDDFETLNKFDLEDLQGMIENMGDHAANLPPFGNPKKKKKKKGELEEEETDEEEEVPAGNSESEADIDKWLSTAPEQIQSIVKNAIAHEQEQRDELVSQIIANESNSFEEDTLYGFTLPQLEGIAKLAENASGAPAPKPSKRNNYAGNSPAVNSKRKPSGHDEAPLIVPTINWAENAKMLR